MSNEARKFEDLFNDVLHFQDVIEYVSDRLDDNKFPSQVRALGKILYLGNEYLEDVLQRAGLNAPE